MEINKENTPQLNGIAEIISEIIKLYDKIPNQSESEQMIDSFLTKYNLSDQTKALIKENLEKYKITSFHKEEIIRFIQAKIENEFNLDSFNSSKIVNYGLEFFQNYIVIAQKKQKNEILKAENKINEIEFNNYLSELNIKINLEIDIKKKRVNEFTKLTENDLQSDSFIEGTYKVLNQIKDESLSNKRNNQIDRFLNNNLDEIIEL